MAQQIEVEELEEDVEILETEDELLEELVVEIDELLEVELDVIELLEDEVASTAAAIVTEQSRIYGVPTVPNSPWLSQMANS
jgi:hypothetical protein